MSQMQRAFRHTTAHHSKWDKKFAIRSYILSTRIMLSSIETEIQKIIMISLSISSTLCLAWGICICASMSDLGQEKMESKRIALAAFLATSLLVLMLTLGVLADNGKGSNNRIKEPTVQMMQPLAILIKMNECQLGWICCWI